MTQFTDRFLYTPPTPNVSKKFLEKSITKPQQDLSYGANLHATRHFKLFEEPSKHPRVGIGKMKSTNVAFLPMESYADSSTKNSYALSPYRKQCITLPQLNTCCEKQQVKSLNVLPCTTRRLTHDAVNQQKNKSPGEMFSEICSPKHCSIKVFENNANKVTPCQWSSNSLKDTRQPVNTKNLKSCVFYQYPQQCLEMTNKRNSSVNNFLSPGVAVTEKQPQYFSLLKDVPNASTGPIAHISSPLSSSTRCSSFSSVSLASEALLSRACQIRKSLKPTTFAPREKTNKAKICLTNRIKDSCVSQCHNVQKGMNPRLEACQKNVLKQCYKGHSEINSEKNTEPWCSLKSSLIYCDSNEKVSGQIPHGGESSKPREMCQKESVSHLGQNYEKDVHLSESIFNKHYGVNETRYTFGKDFQNNMFRNTCRQKRACDQVNLETSLFNQGFQRSVEKNEKLSLTKTPQLYKGNTLQEDMLFHKCCSTCERSQLTEENKLGVKDGFFCNNFKVKEPEKKKKCCVQYVPSQKFPHKVVDTSKSKQETFALNASLVKDTNNSQSFPKTCVSLHPMRPISAKNGYHWRSANEDNLGDESICTEHEIYEKGHDHSLHKHAQCNSVSSSLMSPMFSKVCKIDKQGSISHSEEDSASCFNEKDSSKDVVRNIFSEHSSVTENLDREESQEMDENFSNTNQSGKKKRGFETKDIYTKTWKKTNPSNKKSVNTEQHMQDDLWKHYYHYRFQSCTSQPKMKSISKNGHPNQHPCFYNEDMPPYSYKVSTHHLPEKNVVCPQNITPLSHVEHPCSTCLDTNVVLKVLQKIAEENIKDNTKRKRSINSTHWALGDYFRKKQSVDSSETKHYLIRFGVTLTLTFLVLGAIVVLIFFSLRRHPKVQSHPITNFADDMFNLSSLDDNFGNDFYLTSNQMM